jgi:acetyl esterase/lipase
MEGATNATGDRRISEPLRWTARRSPSEGEAIVAKLQAAGVSVETETFPGVAQEFLPACGGVQKARDALTLVGVGLKLLLGSG